MISHCPAVPKATLCPAGCITLEPAPQLRPAWRSGTWMWKRVSFNEKKSERKAALKKLTYRHQARRASRCRHRKGPTRASFQERARSREGDAVPRAIVLASAIIHHVFCAGKHEGIGGSIAQQKPNSPTFRERTRKTAHRSNLHMACASR